MKAMDRNARPEIADELEFTRENLAFGQMSFAKKQMTIIRRDLDAVSFARTLEEAQEIATQRARFTKRPKLVQDLQRRRIWGDLGALKRWLEDDLLRERNEFARRMMKDIEAERVQ